MLYHGGARDAHRTLQHKSTATSLRRNSVAPIGGRSRKLNPRCKCQIQCSGTGGGLQQTSLHLPRTMRPSQRFQMPVGRLVSRRIDVSRCAPLIMAQNTGLIVLRSAKPTRSSALSSSPTLPGSECSHRRMYRRVRRCGLHMDDQGNRTRRLFRCSHARCSRATSAYAECECGEERWEGVAAVLELGGDAST